MRFVRTESAERRVQKEPTALTPDFARLGEKLDGAEERWKRGFGAEIEVTKQDPSGPEPTDGVKLGDGMGAEGESGLPLPEASLDRRAGMQPTSWRVRSRASFHEEDDDEDKEDREEKEAETAKRRSAVALAVSPSASRSRTES